MHRAICSARSTSCRPLCSILAVQVRSLIELGIGPESLPKKLRRLASGQSVSGPRAMAQQAQQAQQQLQQHSDAPPDAASSFDQHLPAAGFASAPDLQPSRGGALSLAKTCQMPRLGDDSCIAATVHWATSSMTSI